MPSTLLGDFFVDPASWLVVASGQAKGKLTEVKGPDGKPGLRLDYDFHGGGGFVVMRKEVHFTLPETFEFSLGLRGDGLRNHFEFKVADPGGSNAWRFLQSEFQLPEDWQTVRIRERDLPFAWGPAGGGGPPAVGAIELVIAAGPGGSGWVCFTELALEDQSLHLFNDVRASSHTVDSNPADVFSSETADLWRAAPDDEHPWWEVDFGQMIRFGGLVIDWPEADLSRGYQIDCSADGETWTELYKATQALGFRSHIPAPYAESRMLRFRFDDARSAAISSLRLRPDAFSHTPNEFIHAVVVDFPRGWFPRYWYREQSYWAPVGSPEGKRRGLVNEEGLVEVDEAGFSLEPFLWVAGKLVTWADAEIRLALADDGAPFPEVHWTVGEVVVRVMPWVDGCGESMVLRVTYQVSNPAGHDLQLMVAVRPYQVNPPWQAFRNLGGRSPIHEISCEPGGLRVDQRRVETSVSPAASGAAAFEQGGVVAFMAGGKLPAQKTISDPSGLASAAMQWQVGAHLEVTVSVPFYETAVPLTAGARENAIARWREMLAPVEWRVPTMAKDAVACFRTAATHILINRDGPAIQPGPRRYTRSWVRDCVIMGAALAKADCPHALREFVNWYVQFQREDGFVPCVVDRDGIDWLVEHDSHGQLIWGICEVYRHGGDLEFLRAMWPAVSRAAGYLLSLRAQRMTPEYSEPQRSASYGLLPESASHEGYLAHPVHSYWDDFWGIRGLDAATEIALALGFQNQAEAWAVESRAFLVDVKHSLDKVITDRKIDYIPGSVEWADFDPTATSNAIAQLDFADDLPQGPLHQMLETYLEGFRKKHRGEIPWLNYTAYEIRIIGAFVRIGKREEANELLNFFLSDRRPLEWNQWPEITWRDPRSPGHLGDVPHTWIAAEYLLALAAMVASEREASCQIVLASGLPWAWIAEENGFAVRGLMTRYGRLDFEIKASSPDQIDFRVGESLTLPPGGLVLTPPLPPGYEILATSHPALEIHSGGASVAVLALPISATLRLGKIFESPTLASR
jgi:F5/8 type C domain